MMHSIPCDRIRDDSSSTAASSGSFLLGRRLRNLECVEDVYYPGDGGEEEGHVDGCQVLPSILERHCKCLDGGKKGMESDHHQLWWSTTTLAHMLHRIRRYRSCSSRSGDEEQGSIK